MCTTALPCDLAHAPALDFVRQHGVVLLAARGPVPRLVDVLAGEPVRGSWWAHPRSHQIFTQLQEVCGAPEVLVCRLVNAKVTLLHQRLWPALVRVADRFPLNQLTQVQQEHSAGGKHVNHELPYPLWVPAQALALAQQLTPQQAAALLGPWIPKASDRHT